MRLAVQAVQAFLDSPASARDLISLAATLGQAECELTQEGIRLVGGCFLDDVAQKVRAVAQSFLDGVEEDKLTERYAGRRVVALLKDFYNATDLLVEQAPIAEYGCEDCKQIAESTDVESGVEEGLSVNFRECAKCAAFIRNVQISADLKLGSLFKKNSNHMFLEYTKAQFIQTFGGEFTVDPSGRLIHPHADTIYKDKDRVIASQRALIWRATQSL